MSLYHYRCCSIKTTENSCKTIILHLFYFYIANFNTRVNRFYLVLGIVEDRLLLVGIKL